MPISFQDLIDIDLLAYFKAKLDLLFADKVDKVDGKGLSSNDYTSDEKTKLANIASGAQVNVLEGVQVNGSSVSPVNKIANISVPSATSDLDNDSGFITASDVPEGAAASTTIPAMDGTAATGSETTFARGDHVHPSDTSKQAKITSSGMLKGDGNGGVSAAVAGADYQEPLTAGTDYAEPSDIPDASNSNPVMDGIAAAGSSSDYAREDHVHPSDTSRQAKITASGLLKGNGSGGVSAAVAGTDYQAPLTFDNSPASGSNNPITSGGVYAAIAALGSVLNYKGTVATTSLLPASNNSTGDVYHVTADGGEYAWNGSAWEPLGSEIDLSGYVETSDISLATTADIDDLFED